MGVAMYWIIIAMVVVLGMVMPQHGRKRIYYIGTMAVLHALVSGLRYRYLTGDMMSYERIYWECMNNDYFSEQMLNEGINTGFHWFNKAVAVLTDGDYQLYLLLIAIIVEIAVAVLVYRYSPRPWVSFLVWNCMSFYIFGFSAIKQSLAMAFVVLAMVEILENRLGRFLLLTLIAGSIHFPAYAFLPAYWIAKAKIRPLTILCYIAAALVIFRFQTPIVHYITDIYYEDGDMVLAESVALGGRFKMMVVAAIFQMFSGFDNIFTRFADYYFQMAILFLPMMVSSPATDARLGGSSRTAIFRFNKRSLEAIAVCMALYLVWYYNRTCLGTTISVAVDNFLNYRSMWYVK